MITIIEKGIIVEPHLWQSS